MKGQNKPANHPHDCEFTHPTDPEWVITPPPNRLPKYLARTPSPSPPPPATLVTLRKPSTSSRPTKEKNEPAALRKLIKLRADYDTLSEQHKKLRQMAEAESMNNSDLPSGQELATAKLISQRDAVEKEMNSLLIRLLEWEQNILPNFDSNPALEFNISQLQTLFEELKHRLDEAEELQKQVAVASATADPDGDITMDAPSPLKRKFSSSDTSGLPTLPLSGKHFAYVQDLLGKVTQKVDSMEKDVNAQEEDMKNLIQSYVNSNGTADNAAEAAIQESVDTLEYEVSELPGFIEGIWAENSKLDMKYEKAKKINEQQVGELHKLTSQLEDLQRQQEREDMELNMLTVELASFLKRPVSPPFNPEDVAMELDEQVTELIRSALRPQIETLRSELAEEMLKHDMEAYDTLAPKLITARKFVDGISSITPSS